LFNALDSISLEKILNAYMLEPLLIDYTERI
jgi:hypothetical protein